MNKMMRVKGMVLMSAMIMTALFITPAILSAQSQFTSEGGDWLILISGKIKGTAKFTLTDPVPGVSTVTGNGFIRGMGKRFLVKEIPAQNLRIQSNGNIVTDSPLVIIDAGDNILGEFTIEHGKADKIFEKLSLVGTFTGEGTSPVKVSLKGLRFSGTPPVLEGSTFEGKISGGGLKSSRFPFLITQTEELLGYPFLSVTGVGPIRIDGEETNGVDVDSEFIVDHKGNVIGDFISTKLGEGEIKGTLKSSKHGPVFKVTTIISNPLENRFSISALINPEVGARLAVTPTDDPVDFGQIKTGSQKNIVFRLTNTGGLVLEGTATIEGTGTDAFEVTSGFSYTIAPNKSENVTVQFKPTVARTYEATVRFTGDEEGDVLRNMIGVGTPP